MGMIIGLNSQGVIVITTKDGEKVLIKLKDDHAFNAVLYIEADPSIRVRNVRQGQSDTAKYANLMKKTTINASDS